MADLLAGIDIPDPLPLRSIPVPPEVTRVEGCNCGGVEWHLAESWGTPACSIWALPRDHVMAAIGESRARRRAFGAALDEKLRAALAATS